MNPRVVIAVAALGLFAGLARPMDRAEGGSAGALRGAVSEGSLVTFPRPDLGYLVTAGGAVRRSSDGGRTWRQVGSVAPLLAIDFPSPSHGFGVSTRGVLMTTSDAGRTWRTGRRFAPASTERLGPTSRTVVDFVDEEYGFVAAGPKRIFRTANGGRSWTRLAFGCPYSNYLGGLAFSTRRDGFVACGGQPATAMQRRAYHFTSDGGKSWRGGRSHIASGHVALLASPSAGVRYVYASRLGIFRLGGPRVLFTDDVDSVLAMSWPTPRIGYALLLHGGLKRTRDGGRRWGRP